MNQVPESGSLSIEPLPVGSSVACDRCGTGVLQSTHIKTAFWQGEGLVVVRNIPAMICPDCGEQYVDDHTVVRLDVMRGAGFATLPMIDRVMVAILDYGGVE